MPGQPGVLIETLGELLDDRKPLFHEKGLSHIWNEFKAIYNAALAAYTGDVGAVDLVDDLDPDCTELGPSTGKYTPTGAVDNSYCRLAGFIT